MPKSQLNVNKKKPARVWASQPEGTLKTYSRSGQYVFVESGDLYNGQQDGNKMDIVYGENGKVYLKNILCGTDSYFGDSWVEGTIAGNEIHVPLGQSIYYSEDYGTNVVLAMGQTTIDEDGYFSFIKDNRIVEAIYLIEGETITLQGTEGPSELDPMDENSYLATGLGAYWEDDDSWSGFIEWHTVLTELVVPPPPVVITPGVITEIPEGCDVHSYDRISGYISRSYYGINHGPTQGKFSVAFDSKNGEVYIQNPVWFYDSYKVWVKGTYTRSDEGVILTIPTGQYLTWNDDSEYGIQLVWGSTYVYQEDSYGDYLLGYMIDENTTEIKFLLDDDCIYLLGSEGDANAEFPEWANATGLMTIYSDDESMTSIEFAIPDKNGDYYPFGRQENLILPVVPANPTAVRWYDSGSEDGNSRICFTLPTTDVKGSPIDPGRLSVSIYLANEDGPELFTFEAATYSRDLTEDMTEIPYNIYSSGYDFHPTCFYFYRTNAKGYTPLFTHSIGVQVHYIDAVYDMKYSSDIVWWDYSHSGFSIDPPTASIQSGSVVPPGTKVYLSAYSEFGDSYIYYAVEPALFNLSENDLEWRDYDHQQGITIDKDMRIYAYQRDNADHGGNKSEVAVFTYYVEDTILTGDANGDGEVNIADINAIIDAILNDEMEDRFDVNRDGELNIADINAVIDIILNN